MEQQHQTERAATERQHLSEQAAQLALFGCLTGAFNTAVALVAPGVDLFPLPKYLPENNPPQTPQVDHPASDF